MESKAPAEAPQTMFNLDHIVQQHTFDDERTHGDKSVFTTDINTHFNDANDHDTSGMSVTGLGILASSSADLKETPKKKRKKKRAAPKQAARKASKAAKKKRGVKKSVKAAKKSATGRSKKSAKKPAKKTRRKARKKG